MLVVGYSERERENEGDGEGERERAEETGKKRRLMVPLADISTRMGRGAGNREVSEGRGWRAEERSGEERMGTWREQHRWTPRRGMRVRGVGQ